ncbi:MAG: hypothetical protein V3S48_03300 [Candidatus Neomarinimicrobiota bacterium]
MILLTLMWIIIILFILLVIMLSFTFNLMLCGNFKYSNSLKDFRGVIHFGGKSMGITIFTNTGIKIGLGKYAKPLLTFALPRKKSKDKSRLKVKSPIKKRIKSRWKTGLIILKKIRFDYLELKGTFGFSNPMHSGLAFGWVQALRGAVNCPKLKIDIRPQYNNQPESDLEGNLSLGFKPIVLAWYGLRMII